MLIYNAVINTILVICGIVAGLIWLARLAHLVGEIIRLQAYSRHDPTYVLLPFYPLTTRPFVGQAAAQYRGSVQVISTIARQRLVEKRLREENEARLASGLPTDGPLRGSRGDNTEDVQPGGLMGNKAATTVSLVPSPGSSAKEMAQWEKQAGKNNGDALRSEASLNDPVSMNAEVAELECSLQQLVQASAAAALPGTTTTAVRVRDDREEKMSSSDAPRAPVTQAGTRREKARAGSATKVVEKHRKRQAQRLRAMEKQNQHFKHLFTAVFGSGDIALDLLSETHQASPVLGLQVPLRLAGRESLAVESSPAGEDASHALTSHSPAAASGGITRRKNDVDDTNNTNNNRANNGVTAGKGEVRLRFQRGHIELATAQPSFLVDVEGANARQDAVVYRSARDSPRVPSPLLPAVSSTQLTTPVPSRMPLTPESKRTLLELFLATEAAKWAEDLTRGQTAGVQPLPASLAGKPSVPSGAHPTAPAVPTGRASPRRSTLRPDHLPIAGTATDLRVAQRLLTAFIHSLLMQSESRTQHQPLDLYATPDVPRQTLRSRTEKRLFRQMESAAEVHELLARFRVLSALQPHYSTLSISADLHAVRLLVRHWGTGKGSGHAPVLPLAPPPTLSKKMTSFGGSSPTDSLQHRTPHADRYSRLTQSHTGFEAIQSALGASPWGRTSSFYNARLRRQSYDSTAGSALSPLSGSAMGASGHEREDVDGHEDVPNRAAAVEQAALTPPSLSAGAMEAASEFLAAIARAKESGTTRSRQSSDDTGELAAGQQERRTSMPGDPALTVADRPPPLSAALLQTLNAPGRATTSARPASVTTQKSPSTPASRTPNVLNDILAPVADGEKTPSVPAPFDLRIAYILAADRHSLLRAITVEATQTFAHATTSFLCFYHSGDERRTRRQRAKQLERQRQREAEYERTRRIHEALLQAQADERASARASRAVSVGGAGSTIATGARTSAAQPFGSAVKSNVRVNTTPPPPPPLSDDAVVVVADRPLMATQASAGSDSVCGDGDDATDLPAAVVRNARRQTTVPCHEDDVNQPATVDVTAPITLLSQETYGDPNASTLRPATRLTSPLEAPPSVTGSTSPLEASPLVSAAANRASSPRRASGSPPTPLLRLPSFGLEANRSGDGFTEESHTPRTPQVDAVENNTVADGVARNGTDSLTFSQPLLSFDSTVSAHTLEEDSVWPHEHQEPASPRTRTTLATATATVVPSPINASLPPTSHGGKKSSLDLSVLTPIDAAIHVETSPAFLGNWPNDRAPTKTGATLRPEKQGGGRGWRGAGHQQANRRPPTPPPLFAFESEDAHSVYSLDEDVDRYRASVRVSLPGQTYVMSTKRVNRSGGEAADSRRARSRGGTGRRSDSRGSSGRSTRTSRTSSSSSSSTGSVMTGARLRRGASGGGDTVEGGISSLPAAGTSGEGANLRFPRGTLVAEGPSGVEVSQLAVEALRHRVWDYLSDASSHEGDEEDITSTNTDFRASETDSASEGPPSDFDRSLGSDASGEVDERRRQLRQTRAAMRDLAWRRRVRERQRRRQRRQRRRAQMRRRRRQRAKRRRRLRRKAMRAPLAVDLPVAMGVLFFVPSPAPILRDIPTLRPGTEQQQQRDGGGSGRRRRQRAGNSGGRAARSGRGAGSASTGVCVDANGYVLPPFPTLTCSTAARHAAFATPHMPTSKCGIPAGAATHDHQPPSQSDQSASLFVCITLLYGATGADVAIALSQAAKTREERLAHLTLDDEMAPTDAASVLSRESTQLWLRGTSVHGSTHARTASTNTLPPPSRYAPADQSLGEYHASTRPSTPLPPLGHTTPPPPPTQAEDGTPLHARPQEPLSSPPSLMPEERPNSRSGTAPHSPMVSSRAVHVGIAGDGALEGSLWSVMSDDFADAQSCSAESHVSAPTDGQPPSWPAPSPLPPPPTPPSVPARVAALHTSRPHNPVPPEATATTSDETLPAVLLVPEPSRGSHNSSGAFSPNAVDAPMGGSTHTAPCLLEGPLLDVDEPTDDVDPLAPLTRPELYPEGLGVPVALHYMRVGDDLYAVTEIVDRTFIQYRQRRVRLTGAAAAAAAAAAASEVASARADGRASTLEEVSAFLDAPRHPPRSLSSSGSGHDNVSGEQADQDKELSSNTSLLFSEAVKAHKSRSRSTSLLQSEGEPTNASFASTGSRGSDSGGSGGGGAGGFRPGTPIDAVVRATRATTRPGSRRSGRSRREAASAKGFGDLTYSFRADVTVPGMRRELVHICWRCLTAEADVVLVPCGHFAVCASCAAALQSCCICQKEITGTIRLYHSGDE